MILKPKLAKTQSASTGKFASRSASKERIDIAALWCSIESCGFDSPGGERDGLSCWVVNFAFLVSLKLCSH